MLIFDTETTGLYSSIEAPLRTLPKIIELFALKVDDSSLEIKDELHLLIDPGEPLSEEIVKITSITDQMVRGQGQFATHLHKISEFWLGERWAVGHNVTYDCDMLEIELRRVGKRNRFPWTPNRACTVELTEHLEGRRMNLTDLHTLLTGEGFESAHRAEADVRATYAVVKELRKRGEFPF